MNAQNILIVKDGVGICPNGVISLSTTDPTLISYQWQILRGTGWSAINSATANSPKLTHNEAGIYRLLGTDGTATSRISNEVIVNLLPSPPVPVITPSRAVNQICQGDSIMLSTTTVNDYFYYWNFNGNQLVIPQTDKIVAKKAGVYLLQITDGRVTSNSCTAFSLPFKLDYSSVDSVVIDVVPPICDVKKAPINLIAKPLGGKFKGQGITDATLGTFSPSVAGLGKHLITYAVSAAGNCPEVKGERTIIVATPSANITTNTGRTQFCQGDLAILTAPAGLKKYEWFFEGSTTPIGTLDNIQLLADAKLILKVTDAETCTNTSAPIKIEFFAPSNVKLEAIASVCGTEFPAVALKASPTGGEFTINGAFATTFDYKKIGFGKHKVEYKINGALPCLQGSDSQEVLIQDFPRPNLGDEILLAKGNGITLRGFIDPTMTYLWSPSGGLDNPNVANPVASPSATQIYTLKVKTTLGCEGSGSVSVVVYEPVYIPTAFTPNGDSMNDVWELEGMQAYPSAEVQIYNRWGNVIFSSRGDYKSKPFDGSDSNKPLPEGVYVYKISPFPNRPEFQYKGSFMLLR